MKAFIPYGKQDISNEDIQSVIDVLHSDYLTQGPKAISFAKEVAQYCGTKYAVAMNSATSALHVACLALQLGPGDIVWTSPNSFLASSNCALYCGATVDFVDIDPATYNISLEALKEKLEKATISNRLPKVLIPVHFAGQSCLMREIKSLCDKYNIKIIEDASHAIGGEYLNQKIGNCQFSDICVFSFHPVKIITAAEGGMVLTNNEDLYKKMMLFHSHGVTRDSQIMTESSHGAWYYQQIALGFNYRMTELQAALGLSQLNRIEQFIARRRILAQQYEEMLSDLALVLPFQHKDTASSFHLYPVLLKTIEKKKRLSLRKVVFDQLRAANIGVNVHYIPIHTQPYYQKLGFKCGDFPNAEFYYFGAISLPLHFGLTDSEQIYIVETLSKILKENL